MSQRNTRQTTPAGAITPPAPSCPDARLSQPTKQRDHHQILDINTYAPFFLAAVNNALSRGASSLYREKFGIGIVDWRVIAMLAIEPGISAARICEVIALDKAATSRSLQSLTRDGYLKCIASASDTRKKKFWLNGRGYKLHDQVLVFALEREKTLIDGVDPSDLEAFLRVMRTMRANVEKIP